MTSVKFCINTQAKFGTFVWFAKKHNNARRFFGGHCFMEILRLLFCYFLLSFTFLSVHHCVSLRKHGNIILTPLDIRGADRKVNRERCSVL